MAAIDKWAIYDHPAISWEPHHKQLEIAEDYHRHQVVAAGRRFGKSVSGAKKILPYTLIARTRAAALAALGQRMEYWIVGPTYTDSEKEFRVLWNDLKRLEIPLDQGSYNSPETGQMIVKLWDGAFICQAKSAQHPERLVGEGLSGVIMAEAAKLKPSVWYKYIRPTLADFDGWSFFSSTPEGKNWFYDIFGLGNDPDNEEWSSFRCPAWYNPNVYKTPTIDAHVMKLVELKKKTRESVFKLAKDLNLTIDKEILNNINESTPEYFLQEIAADFTEFTGRVFKEFDEDIHVGSLQYNTSSSWATFGAVDFGYTNPNVWLLIQVGPWGEINVLDEVYEPGLDPQDFANEILDRRLCPSSLRYFFPDPASPGDARILEKILGARSRGGTGGELNSRILHIRKALKENRITTPDDFTAGLTAGSERPKLMFDRKCKSTIKDMLDYRYPEKDEGKETSLLRYELPMKKSDHGPEALGRFFAGTMGTFGRRHEGTREHTGSFASGNNRRQRREVRATSRTITGQSRRRGQ